MISDKDLKRAYNHLYISLLDYIWPVNVIEILAELEISLYKSFPSLDEVKFNLSKLKSSVFKDVKDDEEILACFDKLNALLDDNDQYVMLNARSEV